MEITQELVKEYFEYREDGNLIWRKSNFNKRFRLGTIAGCKLKDGYMRIRIFGENYIHHRVVFLYHKGYFPKFIDHINGIRHDNRIENLRECTRSQNSYNMPSRIGSTSKYKGVHKNRRYISWSATIVKDGIRTRLGLFKTEEEAAKAYDKRAKELHGEFARLNFPGSGVGEEI